MFDFGKAMELKKKMDAIAEKLDTIIVVGESGDGKFKVSVTVTASKKIKNVSISDDLVQSANKEHLEDLLLIAIDRALEKAQNVTETESRAMAIGGGFPGLS